MKVKVNQNNINSKQENNLDYLSNKKIGIYRKIRTDKKSNYLQEDKTKEKFQKKQYKGELEQIYSEALDLRFSNLIIQGYDYISNIIRFEFEINSNIIFLQEKVSEILYFCFLNKMLILGFTKKADFFKYIKEEYNSNKDSSIIQILNILNINPNDYKNKDFLNKISGNLDFLNLEEYNRQRIKEIMLKEINFYKSAILLNNLYIVIKEKKNTLGKEIQAIILNNYDFLFQLYYITNFMYELSIILDEDELKETKKILEDYNLLLSEEEFVTIIEVIVVFYLSGYKKHLYANYNFLGAINDIVLKVKEALSYKKWCPNKSNFKSWLSNWSKNYIKQYIEGEVRPLEEEEKMNYIYNNIDNIISSNKLEGVGDKNIKKRDGKKGKDDENIREENEIISHNIDTSVDIKTLEAIKRKVFNRSESDISIKYIEIEKELSKLERIKKIKENIDNEKIILENIQENINIFTNKNEIIRYIKDLIISIKNYIENKNDILFKERREKLVDDILEDLNKMDIYKLYTLLFKSVEEIINRKIPLDTNLKNILDIYLANND